MPADRPHDVSALTPAELARARRDLAAGLALAWPGSPVRATMLAHLAAIDAELAARRIRLCSCGYAADDQHSFDGHLLDHPAHHEHPQPGAG
ncbi:MAG TPA: hypothetical protein VGS06_23150 [Streptosporangiaceae bacterium]|nr:hypothetical protein [Streptosporangiaceae bacterium]